MLVACDDDDAPPVGRDLPDASDPDAVIPSPSDPDVYDVPDARPEPPVGCVAPGLPASRSAFALTPVFDEQLDATARDQITSLIESPHQAGRWYVTTRLGKLYTFRADEVGAELVLDLGPKVITNNNELGLFSVAMDPTPGAERDLYLTYAAAPRPGFNHTGRVARFTLSEDGTAAELDSEEIIIDIDDPATSHNANQIAFGPDGYLYLATGDGGNPNDRFGNGQNRDTLLGTVIRIDPSTPDAERGTAYSIPDDNPFVAGGGAPEVWIWGLRNPWRFSFDSEQGDIWIGDVGQDTWEEVNRTATSANFGWPRMEGSDCFLDPECASDDSLMDPFWAYTHAEGASITGGFVYRGDAIESLYGQYLTADFVNGAIWAVTIPEDDSAPEATLHLESGLNISTFAEDQNGELYVVHFAPEGRGGVFRLDPAPPPQEDTFPRTLSETRCVDMANPYVAPEGMFAYEPAAPLWSDGADKARYFVIPPDRRIQVNDDGDFDLPVGTVIVKHFGFETDIHETRLYVHHEEGWGGYSYRWRADDSEADLLETSFTEVLPNGVRWVYPSRSQCTQCHTSQAGITLGLEYLQLAYEHEALDPDARQFEAMIEQGLFNEAGNERLQNLQTNVDPIPPVWGDAPLDERARGYLHSNCASCHRPGGPSAQGNLDLRFTTDFANMNVCDATPTQGGLYRPDGAELRLLIPGQHEKSIIFLRMETLNLFRMPALGSGVADEQGLALIRDWIDSIEACP